MINRGLSEHTRPIRVSTRGLSEHTRDVGINLRTLGVYQGYGDQPEDSQSTPGIL